MLLNIKNYFNIAFQTVQCVLMSVFLLSKQFFLNIQRLQQQTNKRNNKKLLIILTKNA